MIDRFCALIGRLGGTAAEARAVAARLLDAWSAPGRHYHDTLHLTECLDELDRTEPGNDVVELALWYHDVVYDTHAHDNEQRSADELLRDAATLAIPATTAAHAARLVLATAHTGTPPADPDTALMLDIDLSILGREPARFMAYERAIREEYAHVPADAFRAARGKILAAFLARPVLFHRADVRARYEAQARDNLRALLAAYA